MTSVPFNVVGLRRRMLTHRQCGHDAEAIAVPEVICLSS